MSEHTKHHSRQNDEVTATSDPSAFSFADARAKDYSTQAELEFPTADTAPRLPFLTSAEIIAHPALDALARRGLLETYRLSKTQSALKRLVDVIGSLCAIVLSSPVAIVIGVLLAFQRGPVMFAQERIGERGRIFRCYKFRTMRVDADTMLADLLERDNEAFEEWSETSKLTKDPRITGLGAFLRKTSLDELPQLVNVLKGEMSLVGPRPIVWREVPRYRDFIRYYLSVKPGMTGLWQVSGRNHTTYPRRVALDRAYVRKYSLGLDMAILMRTIPALVRGEGAY